MSYSSLSAHQTMAFDEVRNSVYAQQLAKRLTPESVVLDLGAGLGILGLLAAVAGARRVYLVEPEPVVQFAIELARANHVADRIIILQGRIEDVKLPEQVDIILSVFTGNLLFNEDLLPSLFYARDQYLKPSGCLLPDRAELLIAPLNAPQLHEEHVAAWSASGTVLDLAAARRIAANNIVWLWQKELALSLMSAAVVLATVDLMTATAADCHAIAQCQINKAGLCHGLLGWITIRVGDKWLDTAPASPQLHWSNGFLPLDPPLPLAVDELVTITLQRPVGGDWSWKVVAMAGTRQHSTFLGRVDGHARMQRLSAMSRPGLNSKGLATLHVLTLLEKGHSNNEITSAITAGFPQLFRSIPEALHFVVGIVDKLGGGLPETS